jgi:S-DNA-T family DNA segregation ATPase FtsK/SpoIIIE
MRLAGGALIVMAGIGWISLASWSIGDPSLNSATGGAPRNLLGMTGASLADMLFQMVGLASITLFLPPAAWGFTLFMGETVFAPRHRLAMWSLSVLLIASTLSMIPKPESWPLVHGLGGVIGDFGKSLLLSLGGMLSERLALALGSAGAGFLGLWTLLRACGVGRHELGLLWQSSSQPGSGLPGLFAHAYHGISGLRSRISDSLERETAYKRPVSHPYWQPEDADRFNPSRRAEGSFNPRFSGHAFAEARSAAPARRAVPETPAPRIYMPARRNDGRIEPYFDAVKVIPRQQSGRAGAPPAPPARQAPPRSEPHPPARPAADARPDARGDDEPHWDRHYDPIAYEDDAAPFEDGREDDLSGQDDIYEPEAEYDAPASAAPIYRGQPLSPARRAQPMPDRSAPGYRAALHEWQPEEFQLPPLKLLAPPPPRQNDPELSDAALGRRAEMLQSVLEDFRVKGQITGVHPGPVITLYEFEPARGTKSSRVISLADDIARSMSAVSARVAVIPGRDAIGIELPNRNREIVFLRELLEAKDFQEGKGRLQLALGKTIGGDPVIVDLARMPHLLIAGTTGSGKSVAINTMILSLLYRMTPEDCRFIMIDPKMLELSVYDGIPHLLTPVVTDPHQAIKALKWTVAEMNSRYERMCKLGVRNIMGFNQKVARAKRTGEPLARTVQTGFDEETGSAIYERENIDPAPMPYIVVVIDEMADLMMVAGKDIEFAVQRLSQMARAAGIHLIMATQRPSVDVITGTIKANFPSRISFQVTSKIDSRTILGEQGAEQLLGAGDMLTMAAGGRIMRAHGPFVSDDEVESIVGFLRMQGEPDYMDGLLDDGEAEDGGYNGRGGDMGARINSGDDVYDQAVDIVLRDRRPTTSYLQRRLGIGYNKAASLIERMEADGVISAPNRTGKREVLAGGEA